MTRVQVESPQTVRGGVSTIFLNIPEDGMVVGTHWAVSIVPRVVRAGGYYFALTKQISNDATIVPGETIAVVVPVDMTGF